MQDDQSYMILEEQYAETQMFCCRVGFCISVFVIVLHIYDVSLDENLPGNGVTSKYFRFVSGKDRSWCRDRSTRWLAESLREVRAYLHETQTVSSWRHSRCMHCRSQSDVHQMYRIIVNFLSWKLNVQLGGSSLILFCHWVRP